jgi:hypothetical protein
MPITSAHDRRSNVCPESDAMRRLISRSRVTGHFQGFETGQLLELQNGDTWQQDAVKSRYAYGYRPKVSVWQEGSNYYMEVSGMHELIHVRRVQVNHVSSINARGFYSRFATLPLMVRSSSAIHARRSRGSGTPVV